jgi:hypothetical protein
MARFFSPFPQSPDLLRGPPSLLSNGHRGVKRPGVCEAYHSTPPSAEVKNGGAISPFPVPRDTENKNLHILMEVIYG